MNNTNYSYNTACWTIKGDNGGSTTGIKKKQFVLSLRKMQFARYKKFFEAEMNSTVQNNNSGIYK